VGYWYLSYPSADREVEMVNQGRLTKVMLLLVVAMTAGALVLLALEGKPIKPMPFSLSSQIQLNNIHSTLGTEAGIELGRWNRIEVSYLPEKSNLFSENRLSNQISNDYHFVISNGSLGKDGQIFATHRWLKQLSCNNLASDRTIKICLITDAATPRKSTLQQTSQLEDLAKSLVLSCQIEPKIIWKNR